MYPQHQRYRQHRSGKSFLSQWGYVKRDVAPPLLGNQLKANYNCHSNEPKYESRLKPVIVHRLNLTKEDAQLT